MKKKIADNFFSAIDNSSNLVNRYKAETVLNNKGIESFEVEVPNEGFVDVTLDKLIAKLGPPPGPFRL
ncbi:hypothetical protein BOTNAR_0128g00020 [Botryotinia narcissicola]|uniref:Uncharacterized protein n=1 Tax=Botryotinia narcissicola TaxID=278944 RepID=A0A4Z1ILR6_9HELO|nr:hypothetical protein BOTNAR_0128g00020 [Botryotinia narcissicola]